MHIYKICGMRLTCSAEQEVPKVLEYLKPQNCVAIIIESLFTCSRPLEHGCYVQAAKLTANGTVKTFGVGGPNVLDMIGD